MLEETLADRKKVYGSFTAGIEFEAAVERLIMITYKKEHGIEISFEDLKILSKLVMKLSRLAVTPDHSDSWEDVQGYAKLAQEHYNAKIGIEKAVRS